MRSASESDMSDDALWRVTMRAALMRAALISDFV